MATVEHFTYQYDLGAGALLPGQSYWVTYGPADGFRDGTVILKAYPATTDAASVLSVGDIFSTAVPVFAGGTLLSEGHVGASITNAGQQSIRWFSVNLTLIRP
jgi:hypothetical protein